MCRNVKVKCPQECIHGTNLKKALKCGNTHPVIHKNNSAQTEDRFYSDGALSTGLELTDAQADYSAFFGHMTQDLHASPHQ